MNDSPTRGRWVQLPFVFIEDGFQPLVLILPVVFDVPTMAEDVHLSGSDNTTFRALIEDGPRR